MAELKSSLSKYFKKYSEKAIATFDELDARVRDCFEQVKRSRMWSAISDPETPQESVIAVLREIFRAVSWYQPHTTEAGFHMFGRLPKHDAKLIRTLCLHKAEEAEHGLWAREDQRKLGGTNEGADVVPASPASFAVASVWWRMAQVEEPMGYLGAEYLFEKLTALVAPAALEIFGARRLPTAGLRFIIEHATEDQRHADLFKHLILDTVSRYPDSTEAMLRCYDYFNCVYPLPLWEEACTRAVTAIAA